MSEIGGSRLPRGRQPARDGINARTLLLGYRPAEHLGRPVLGRIHRRRHHRHPLRGGRARSVRPGHRLGQRDHGLPVGRHLPAGRRLCPAEAGARAHRPDLRGACPARQKGGRRDQLHLFRRSMWARWSGSARKWPGPRSCSPKAPARRGTRRSGPSKWRYPFAGLLLLLQGIANLVRELGIVPEAEPAP